MMGRTFRLVFIAAVVPGCLDPEGGPPAEETWSLTSGSTEGSGSTGGEGSSSSSGSSSTGGGESLGETSSTSSGGDETTGGATGEQTSTTTSSSSGSGSFCGDGVVDPGEECDDANTEIEDSCNLICARRRTVFVSSEAFDPAFIGGLENADSLCRQFAQKMGSEHWLSFVAWMSDSKTSAIERIFWGKGVYARPDGVIVADNVQQFASGELLAPINVSEKGESFLGASVWTGTRPDGFKVPGSQHCDDWTSNDLFKQGHIGDAGSSNSDWTYVSLPDVNPTSCIAKLRIYCIEGA